MNLTVATLMEIMCNCAGEGEGLAAGQDVHDMSFEDLGYDSLALLETASRIERDYGVRLADDEVTEARTPRAFLALVEESAAEVA